MRFLLTLITSLILLLPASGQGEWEKAEVYIEVGISCSGQLEEMGGGFSDVLFIDRDKGFITWFYVCHFRHFGSLHMTKDGVCAVSKLRIPDMLKLRDDFIASKRFSALQNPFFFSVRFGS